MALLGVTLSISLIGRTLGPSMNGLLLAQKVDSLHSSPRKYDMQTLQSLGSTVC